MAHNHPKHPFFTVEICRRGILQKPFRLIDVGVLGGIGAHWLFFGDHLEVWGFDPLAEAIAPLTAANKHPDRMHYFNMALGDADDMRPFRFYPENPFSSHFAASNGCDDTAIDTKWQDVPLRRLDTLFAEGTVGPVDFMKMDAETYEVEIVRGAQKFFAESGIFGVESETSFFRTPRNPRSHFVELFEELGPLGFDIYDAGIQRAPKAEMARGFPHQTEDGYKTRPVGRAWAFDFLFLRGFDGEYSTVEIDRLLKMIAIAETYGLHDIGLSILFANEDRLGGRLDIEQGADWLVRERSDTTLTYREYRRLP
jgi:FkbM family methyltransferase